jgi:hypothetical protein
MNEENRPEKTNETLQSKYDNLTRNIHLSLSSPEFYRSNASPYGKAIAFIGTATIFGCTVMGCYKVDYVYLIIVAFFSIILCAILAITNANQNGQDPP